MYMYVSCIRSTCNMFIWRLARRIYDRYFTSQIQIIEITLQAKGGPRPRHPWGSLWLVQITAAGFSFGDREAEGGGRGSGNAN